MLFSLKLRLEIQFFSQCTYVICNFEFFSTYFKYIKLKRTVFVKMGIYLVDTIQIYIFRYVKCAQRIDGNNYLLIVLKNLIFSNACFNFTKYD